jgi:glycine/D-amino acid oxidase-like deaminating enzyme
VSNAQHPALVIGAGVVGLSTALYLQRAGMHVAVIDPLGPAGGASFGNAGMLSPDTATPIAMPGMLRKVPGWLRDPLGPLAVRPSYFPRALPWLMQWVKAGRLQRVLEVSDAMRALHSDTLDCWRELLGDALYHELIRPSGQVHVWEGNDSSPTEAIEQQIRKRHGIRSEPLDANDLRQMFPGIARGITRGLLVPGNAYTVSPQRIVHALADLFQAAGGAIIAERAMKLIPREGRGYTVMKSVFSSAARRTRLSAGHPISGPRR